MRARSRLTQPLRPGFAARPAPAPPACPRSVAELVSGQGSQAWALWARDATLFQLVPGKAVPASNGTEYEERGSVGSAEEGSGAFLGTNIS